MRLLFEAPVLTSSGYGEHARLVYSALKKKGDLDIFVNPLNWGRCTWELPRDELLEDIKKYKLYASQCEREKTNQQYSMQVLVGIPNEFVKKAPVSLCVTAGIETDRISPNWLIKTHQGIDKIIVPSHHAKFGFENTGYEVFNGETQAKTSLTCGCPVDVIPYPVKSPEGKPLDIDFSTNFNFLQIAMLGPRKNAHQSIKCFVEQFRDNPDVGLVLKTSQSRSSVIDRESTRIQLERYVKSLGEKKCKIYFLHGNLTEAEIHSLYTHPKIKAYYTTTHGEGFGLPIFEAAYSGLPVIATDWSGHLDFLSAPHKGKTKKLFAKIGCDIKQVHENAIWGDLIVKDSKWAYPIESSIKAQLEKVYKDHGMYKSWAKSLRSHIVENYTLENILDQYIESIFPKKTQDEAEWEAHLSEIEML